MEEDTNPGRYAGTVAEHLKLTWSGAMVTYALEVMLSNGTRHFVSGFYTCLRLF